MSKHNQSNSADSLSSVGDRILRALTQEEISELIDTLFAVLPDNLRSSALAELEPNTQKTVQEILTPLPLCETTHQSLFQSWRNYIIRRAKPHSHWDMYEKVKSVDIWWLHWLIDSIATPNQGSTWFAQQILQWLTSLPGERRDLGEAYDILRLLTKDLTEIHCLGQPPYPQFYQVVIRPRNLSAPDDTSRRAYLQQYAPNELWDQVMAYWKAQLHQFVPRPELSRNSDYTAHAQWMSALQELAPQSYEILLAQWRVEHQRRRNLWKALEKLGLR